MTERDGFGVGLLMMCCALVVYVVFWLAIFGASVAIIAAAIKWVIA